MELIFGTPRRDVLTGTSLLPQQKLTRHKGAEQAFSPLVNRRFRIGIAIAEQDAA